MFEQFLTSLSRFGKNVGQDVSDRAATLSNLTKGKCHEKRKFTHCELDTDISEIDDDDDDDIKTLKLNLYEYVYEDKIDHFQSCIEKIKRILKRNHEENMPHNLKHHENEDETLKIIINTIEDNRSPILSVVVSWNNLEAAKLLIRHGADVNIKDDIGTVPLHFAAWGTQMTRQSSNPRSFNQNHAAEAENKVTTNAEEQKNEDVIDYFRLCKADPNIQDSGDETPLHNAARRGNSAAVRALLRFHNININISNEEFKTPLHIACSFGWLKVCKLLINANAIITMKDKTGYTPLHYAAAQGGCNIIEFLVQKLNNDGEREKFVNAKARDGETPLTLAIANQREDAVKLLIEKGACMTSKHKKSDTPLHIASSTGNTNIMQILLDNEADINSNNDDLETPLHIACAGNEIGAVDFLLSQYVLRHGQWCSASKADVNARDSQCRTPLLKCLESKPSEFNYKIIEMLVKCGADTKAVDQMDRTAIMSASKMNNINGLKFLLNVKNGKEVVNFVDRRSKSALHYAAEAGNLEQFKCLTENGALLTAKNNLEETPFLVAVEHGHLDVAKYILEQDGSSTSLTEGDSYFDTPLHVAAKKGNCDMVQLLLSHSSGTLLNSLEKQNSLLYTALDYAAVNGHKDVVEILLTNGAKLDAGGYSPLHEACEKGKVNIVKFLLNKGASIDRLDAKHRNCLEVAIDNNREEVAKAIVSDKRWKDVMQHSRDGTTPLRQLIKTMPDVAQVVLDKCVTENVGVSIVYDYELLDDVYSNWSSDYSALTAKGRKKQRIKENGFTDGGWLKTDSKLYSKNISHVKNNHPLMIMVSEKNEKLLGHEIVYRLLARKWHSYVQYIYYTGLFLYILFIAALTDFAVNSTPPYDFNATFFELSPDFCHNETSTTYYSNVIPSVTNHVRISQYITLTVSIMNILKEILQAFFRRKNYFEPQNLLETCLYVCSLLFVVDWNRCSAVYGYRLSDQWLFGVAAVILAWMDLILMIRQFPTIGIYVVMFTDVLRTFIKFFTIFFLFIVTFALAFYMLLQNQAPFETLPRTLVKTLTMMHGEFDTNGIFYSSDEKEKVNYPDASLTVFCIFSLIMAIIIMNLLTGLAVDNIKDVQNKALLKRLAMKVELVLEIEYIAPDFIRRKFMIGKETIKLPEEESLLMKLFHVIFPKSKSESVVDAASELFDDGNKMTEVKRQQEPDDLVKLQKSIEELKSQQVKLESVLSAIATRLNISVVGEPEEEVEPTTDQLTRRW